MERRFNKALAKNIGESLRKIRLSQETNLTQADVADGAGISTRYYVYLELGQRIPTIEVIMRIARAYGMKLSDFVKYFEN